MKQTIHPARILKQFAMISAAGVLFTAISPTRAADGELLSSLRLPGNVPPVMATWGWTLAEFEPGGYETYIGLMARHSGVNVLTTTIRAPGKFVTDAAVHEQIRRASQFASQFGIGIAMDLDVRLAREPFRDKYPDELQQMLRLREVALKDSGEATFSIAGDVLGDHYTGYATPYIPVRGRLVRVYAYERTAHGIKPETVRDITTQCRTTLATTNQVTVAIPCNPDMAGNTACVMISFDHLTPDVFAPHLLSFQRKILENYRDVPLAGACKDEWGFPPSFDGNHPAHNDHWYSHFMAQAYAKATGGRDLVRDTLLMTYGEIGRDAERVAAINQFSELVRRRNGEIETDFYHAVKSIWGKHAVVATHATWWPYPDRREFKKNGLDWWIATRDLAQTDEITPYCARTALAKKWNSPVWFNMYYSPNLSDYEAELWAGALSGGRINYHPLWPTDEKVAANMGRYRGLLRGGLMRGDCRVRLLNFITRSPLDCPVAVIFGQPNAMNWAGQTFGDVGLELCDALWRAGYPADLIPTTEIWNGALKVGRDGYVQYGAQRYRSVVLHRPQFEPVATAAFFQKAAKGKTALYRLGEWTQDFDGKKCEGAKSLPDKMVALADSKSAVKAISTQLADAGIVAHTPANRTLGFADCRSVAPPVAGESRLVDGTHIFVSGAKSASGDPIHRTVQVSGHTVTVDAVGLVAIRLDKRGRLEALAAGGLKTLKSDKFNIELPERVDVALWRGRGGKFHGVLQGWSGSVPASLQVLTKDWVRLSVPVSLE